MMDIVGLDIEINRGNAAGLTIHFDGDDVPSDGTVVLFLIYDADYCSHIVMDKTLFVQDGAIEINFLPEDTENLRPGEYYWNACIQYADGTAPWTLMRDCAKFTVFPG